MNENFNNESYKNAGVDIHAGYKSNKLIQPLIEKTKTAGVFNHINNFSGFFSISNLNFKKPILVSSTDGVGTKIKIASILNKHNTIGIDCVAMCVNDIICSGATPLFFLDYISSGKNIPEKTKTIVEGIAKGCILSKIALIGGETAEHPKIMNADDYDLAGFCVGVVEEANILPKNIEKEGDVLIALPSSGVHSNGFSLIRHIFKETDYNKNFGILEKSLGETLLEPTTIYVEAILNLIKNINIKAICHITGGGFFENIPRILQKNLNAVIFKNKINTPPIFDLISKVGNVPSQHMFNTFNMGVGMICIVDRADVDDVHNILNNFKINSYEIGTLVNGNGTLEIK